MSTTKTKVIANNRLVTIADYVKTFKVCRQVAARMLKEDKTELKVRRYMASHFFTIYDTFPRNFRPIFEEIG